ncbi:multicopper oxidase domain-containing protein [Archangium sp.]|uniref:multicopper oxidase domain-containing protein n=1 Tax=Archangium sp. TaxID=1872627 RepID=UPI00286C1A53|nr:multicopper oxidase domain-containing protein [Archangium sp.]
MDHGNMNHGGDAGHTGMPPQVMDLPASEGALDSAAFVDKSPEPGVIEVDLEARPAEVESLPGRKTVNVPAKSTLRLSVRFDGFPGMWMSHCHILEHGERGMMGELDVSS